MPKDTHFPSIKKTLLTLIMLFFFLWQTSNFNHVNAIYDPLSVPNNKFGIHILDTSELSKAAELVNSSGGDWGYVTIPIRSNERDLEKWTRFMNDCKAKHLIPILRIASFPVGDHWMAPNEWDLIDFSNFLNDLPWPTKNRYVIIYNEPNHQGEWGGFVDPQEYARVLDRAIDIFHKRHEDFFVISAGMDSSAPNSASSMNAYSYLRAMESRINGIFSKVDGFSTHSYGNPAFSTPPNIYSQVNVANYRFELDYLRSIGVENPMLFITEAGWRADLVGDENASKYYANAFQNIWIDKNIVAITPFLLSAQSGPFQGFSYTSPDFKPFAKKQMEMAKTKGQPQVAPNESISASSTISSNNAAKQKNQAPMFETFIHRFLNFLKIRI